MATQLQLIIIIIITIISIIIIIIIKRFREGREDLENDPGSGRPSTVLHPDTVSKIRELVVTDRRITLKPTDQLRINQETKCPILYKDLEKRGSFYHDSEALPAESRLGDQLATSFTGPRPSRRVMFHEVKTALDGK